MNETLNLNQDIITVPDRLPVLPLRDIIIFPHMVHPLVVGRAGTLSAVEKARGSDDLIALIAQKDASIEYPGAADMYRVGVLGRIAQMMKLPNGLAKVLVEGLERIKVVRFHRVDQSIHATIRILEDKSVNTPQLEAARSYVISMFKEFIALNRQIPDEVGM
ncbi:MAG TPA: endopeptidase La, partial [Bacteroidetes bacterium]|nr:endopeptidase La [Bacteroidota bacterium]